MNFVTCEIKAQQPRDLPGWSTFTHFQQSSTAFFVARSSVPQSKFHHPHLRLKLTPEFDQTGTRQPKRCLVPHLVSLRVRFRRNHRECDLGAGELRARECKSCEYRTYLPAWYLPCRDSQGVVAGHYNQHITLKKPSDHTKNQNLTMC